MNEKSKNKVKILYEIIMILLAVVVVTILLLETFFELAEPTVNLLYLIDFWILIIFAIDYAVRLILISDNRKEFVKNNVLDLIAIIPFSSVFRVARVARLARLGRLARLSRMTRLTKMLRFLRVFRVAAVFQKAIKGTKSILKTNGLHLVIIFTMFVMLLGSIGMYKLEKGYSVETFGDSLWWSFVTTTTVGYGDITPVTTGGRILAAILMIIGIGFVGMVTGTIATYFVSKAENLVKENNEIEMIKEKLDKFETLSKEEVKQVSEKLLELKEQKA